MSPIPPLPRHSFPPLLSLVQYIRQKRWVVPGHGDLNVRLEEYVLARDGRWVGVVDGAPGHGGRSQCRQTREKRKSIMCFPSHSMYCEGITVPITWVT